jgi:hypothetical protein
MTPDSGVPCIIIALWMFAAFGVVDCWDRLTR